MLKKYIDWQSPPCAFDLEFTLLETNTTPENESLEDDPFLLVHSPFLKGYASFREGILSLFIVRFISRWFFSNIFVLFIPTWGKFIHFSLIYFFKWVGWFHQPPTRKTHDVPPTNFMEKKKRASSFTAANGGAWGITFAMVLKPSCPQTPEQLDWPWPWKPRNSLDEKNWWMVFFRLRKVEVKHQRLFVEVWGISEMYTFYLYSISILSNGIFTCIWLISMVKVGNKYTIHGCNWRDHWTQFDQDVQTTIKKLAGGFNPCEKYSRQIGSFP